MCYLQRGSLAKYRSVLNLALATLPKRMTWARSSLGKHESADKHQNFTIAGGQKADISP